MGPGIYTLWTSHWMPVTQGRRHELGQGDSLQLKWSPKAAESRELSVSGALSHLIPKERLWDQPHKALNPVSIASKPLD